jgi:hypothetical protein
MGFLSPSNSNDLAAASRWAGLNNEIWFPVFVMRIRCFSMKPSANFLVTKKCLSRCPDSENFADRSTFHGFARSLVRIGTIFFILELVPNGAQNSSANE